jgi:hypothetical protein
MAAQRGPPLIVPLVGPHEAEFRAAAGAANVIYHGGPLLTSARVFTIFWGRRGARRRKRR